MWFSDQCQDGIQFHIHRKVHVFEESLSDFINCMGFLCQNIHFTNGFLFPFSHFSFFSRAKIWVERSGNITLLDCDSRELCGSRSMYLCAEHFSETMFRNNKKNTLNRNALPTIFTDPPLSEEAMACWPVRGALKLRHATRAFPPVNLQDIGTEITNLVSHNFSFLSPLLINFLCLSADVEPGLGQAGAARDQGTLRFYHGFTLYWFCDIQLL